MAKKQGFVQEFKQFVSRGNVMDLAVGIIIGAAFTAIVNSLVKDIIMPLIGWLFGGVDFTALKAVLTEAMGESAEVALTYGNFIQRIIDFLIIALVVFMLVKSINKMRAKAEALKKEEEAAKPAPPPEIPADVVLLKEIRDLLKTQAK
jgi:large conductance mechanosensitive channel